MAHRLSAGIRASRYLAGVSVVAVALSALSLSATADNFTASDQGEFDAAIPQATAAGDHTLAVTATLIEIMGETLSLPGDATTLGLTFNAGNAFTNIRVGDDATLEIGEGTTVVFDAETNMLQFRIGDSTGDGTVDMTGGVVNLDDPTTGSYVYMTIGRDGGTGLFEQSGGTVTLGATTLIGIDEGSGTYRISGGTLNSSTNRSEGHYIYIGYNQYGDLEGTTGTLIIEDTAEVFFKQGARLHVGSADNTVGVATGGTGSIVQTGGSVSFFGQEFQFGSFKPGGVGTYDLQGGTLLIDPTAGGGMDSRPKFGVVAEATGFLNQSGGSLEVTETVLFGQGGTGIYNLSGGTAEFEKGISLAVEGGSTGTVNHTGGTLTLSGGAIAFGAGTGTYNLRDDALLIIGPGAGVTQFTGTGALNLGGGTIEARQTFDSASNATLEEGTESTFDVGDTFVVTWSGVLDGSGGLIKDGAGQLRLAAANTFTGEVSILDGTLALTNALGLTQSNDVDIDADGTLDIGLVASADSTVNIGVLSGEGTINLGANRLKTTIGAGVTSAFSGTITSTGNNWESQHGKFDKEGAGTLVIDGLTMTGGEFHVRGGTIALTGENDENTSIDYLTIGDGDGNNGAMTISGGNLTIGASFAIGHWHGDGTVTQTGGTVTVQANCQIEHCAALLIGNQGGDGVYTISGGELRLVGGAHSIGRNDSQSGGEGTLNISGDALVVLGPNDDADFGSNGYLVIGDRNAGASDPDANGTINQTGGTLRIANASTLYLGGYGNGVYNLDGGVLEIGGTSLKGPYADGTYKFNLGGGTIRVLGEDNGGGDDLVTDVAAELQDGTVSTIDTNGLNATWNGVLSGAGGLRKIGDGILTLGSGENSYQGGTFIEAGIFRAGTPGAFVTNTAYTVNGGTLDVGSNGGLTVSALNGDPGGIIDLGSDDDESAADLTVDGGGVFGGSIVGDGSLNKMGEAVLVLNGASTYTGGTFLDEGELRVGDDDALGTGDLEMSKGTTLSFNAADLVIANVIWFNNDGDVDVTFDTRGFDATLTGGFRIPDDGGATSFTKDGLGTLLLSSDPAGSELLYTVDEATVAAGTLLLDEAIVLGLGEEGDGTLWVLPGATFGGDGILDGHLVNRGIISPGQSPGVLDIMGNYVGGDDVGGDVGTGNFEVDLTAAAPVAGVDYDQLRITGSTSGETVIYLFQPNSGGAPTTPAGGPGALGAIGEIDLIQIGGDNNATFTLGNRVIQGGREVVLEIRSEDNPDESFFEGVDAITVVGLTTGDIAAEVYGYAAATTAARQAGLALLGNYVERRGLDSLAGEARAQRVWARIGGAGYNGDDAGLSQDLWFGQAGIDVVATADGFRAGVMAAYGRSDGDVDTASGSTDLSGDVGMIGVYGNWTDGTTYAEAVLQYAFGDWRMRPDGLGRSSFETDGIGVSVEAGAVLAVSEGLTMIPWAQIAYQSIDFGSVDDAAGLDPDFQDTDSLILRGGVRAVALLDGARLHGGIALAAETMGESGVEVQGLHLDSEASQSWAELSAGADLPLGDGVSLFAQIGYDVGLDGDLSVLRGHGGLRVGW